MNEFERYSRQMRFQPIGEKGQKRLLNSKVAIVGIGALGTVIANHLVRSGVGYVRLIDRDFVELSNLQRQTLFTEKDAISSQPKAYAAKMHLCEVNSEITIEEKIADLNPENAEALLKDMDVIVDGTDNFSARYLINDISIKYNIPWIYGGAISSRGIFAVIKPNVTPCFRCLFPTFSNGRGDTCETVGVLSPLTDIIGSFEAVEALKILTGDDFNQNLVQLDIWDNSFFEMDIRNGKNLSCPTCVHHNYEFLNNVSEMKEIYTTLCGSNIIQIRIPFQKELNLNELEKRLKNSGKVSKNDFLIRFSPDNEITFSIFKDSRVLIHGTNDIVKAKSLYAKYIGS